MYKPLLTSLFFLISLTVFSQTNLQVKKDTVTLQKGELVIQNKTSDTLGFLYNTGNGHTAFRRLHLVNLGDTALAIVGQDTLAYRSSNIGKSIQFKVGEGTNTPIAGDTSYTNNGLRLGNVKVWRNGLFQYRDKSDGIMVDSLTGAIRFYPALAQGDRVYIESLYGVSLTFQLPETPPPTGGSGTILKINFSTTPAPAVPGWFNVYGPVTGNHITATDPITGWTVDNGGGGAEYWTGFGTGSSANSNDSDGTVTGNDSGIVPDIVLQSFWFNYSRKYDTASNIIISGLNAQRTYTVKLVASRKSGVSGARYGVWRINGGAELRQNAIGNTSQQTVITAVAPDAQGRIKVAVYAPVDNTTYGDFSYINALIIEQEQ